MIASSQLNQAKRVYAYEGFAILLNHINEILISRGLNPVVHRRLRNAMVTKVRREVLEEENA